jgi:hypothetical protein
MFEVSGKFKDLCVDLMRREPWDLFLAYLFTIHHSGHRLWSPINIKEALTDSERTELADALRQVYVASDRAVGELLQEAGEGVIVMVLSMHGMGVNNSRTWIFPDMLRRVLGVSDHGSAPIELIKSVRNLVPVECRHRIKSRLPYKVRRWLTRTWV